MISLFERIKKNNARIKSSSDKLSANLADFFFRLDENIYGTIEKLYMLGVFEQVADEVVKAVFDKNEWLDLYLNENDFLSSNLYDALAHKNKFIYLVDSYKSLLPHHNETLDVIIDYLLYNPESDLRQVTISEELHINKSYLSTVFIAQTNTRFVDYVTYVKLMRAAWLLKNTNMKVSEIANRMDYKDIAYFSKQFKKVFNYKPSEYRLPDDYLFQI